MGLLHGAPQLESLSLPDVASLFFATILDDLCNGGSEQIVGINGCDSCGGLHAMMGVC